MPFPRALALSAVVTLLAKNAAAEEPSDMGQAVAEFAAAEQALATSPPCETMCKALQSMIHSAARICELAKDGSPVDKKRCVDAKAKVEDATARVRATCPDCVTKQPDTNVTTATPPSPPAAAKTAASEQQETAGADVGGEAVATASGGRTSSVLLDVSSLVLSPVLVQPRFVRKVGPHTSLALTFGVGSVAKTDGRSNGRTGAVVMGGELRVLIFGRFDAFSAFAGASFTYRHASHEYGEYVTTRSFTEGVMVGPELGTRLVTPSGFTLEARAGVDYLVQDRRGIGAPTDKLLPLAAFSAGRTF